MARRAVIDRGELFETASTMAAEGKDVTALALLTALGGGSLTTIYKYLAEWEAARPKLAALSGVPEVPDVVQNAFVSTWRVATMEAARETVAVKEKAAEDLKAAQKQFDGALEAIQKLEVESEQDAAQIEALKGRVSELDAALAGVGKDNSVLKATNEQLREQVKAQQLELERLHKGIQDDRKERETAIKEAAELKGQAQALKVQNAELMAKLSELAAEFKKPKP